jgi:hypothetical protein
MLQLKNTTSFEAGIAVFPDENGVDALYVTVKATFKLGKTLEVAAEQVPLVYADEYWGEPGQSSLKYASELHLTKPSTDIVMTGEACAPDKRPVSYLDVMLAVGDRKKVVRVFGDRRWINGILGLRISPPIPFESMPLVYERAFGGVHEIDPDKQKILFEAHNPVGKGFKGRRSKKELKGSWLPNLEDPERLITKPSDQPAPACFGYVAPSWEPRKSFAGTYDEVWQQKRAPYLPEDFDNRFFNSAHPDLIFNDYLTGGEPVSITNMSPNGPLKFELPVCDIEAAVRIAGRTENPPLNLETVLIEPNESLLSMLWRAALQCNKKTLKVEHVDINLKNLQINGRSA